MVPPRLVPAIFNAFLLGAVAFPGVGGAGGSEPGTTIAPGLSLLPLLLSELFQKILVSSRDQPGLARPGPREGWMWRGWHWRWAWPSLEKAFFRLDFFVCLSVCFSFFFFVLLLLWGCPDPTWG